MRIRTNRWVESGQGDFGSYLTFNNKCIGVLGLEHFSRAGIMVTCLIMSHVYNLECATIRVTGLVPITHF